MAKVLHVLVVVPRQETLASTHVHQDGVFYPCSDQFFSQFPTVNEVNDWLEFPSLLRLTRRQKLYIRSSYRAIAKQALTNSSTDVKFAVMTGTPGIGKSVFIYFVMWRLIKDQKRVLLFDSDRYIYYDGNMMFTCTSLPDKFNEQFWSPDLWCLVDSMDPTSSAELPYRRCSVLRASTPRLDYVDEFRKSAPAPDVFYMPLWTREELARIAPLYPDAKDVWEKRWTCLGGVPRLVLQDIKTDPQSLADVGVK
ncbi:hypothetical protein PI125_g17129 [Phytophthora idaei]|nr:hypothetical protein PI125_g17129 [Phytophthora idaei]KAG3140377.1 hypothetical protein PI126_g16042 [Phytophthora idaei]